MLHRPILTRLCADTESAASTEVGSPTRPSGPLPLPASRELFKSFAVGCAQLCLEAAMGLIELVHGTYLTKTTGGWWWDGLCMEPPPPFSFPATPVLFALLGLPTDAWGWQTHSPGGWR